jgi:hypothetical protein
MSDFRIDQITNQAGTAGPQIAGITTFSGTSGLLMPSGTTVDRSSQGILGGVSKENLFLYHDLGLSLSSGLLTDLSGNNLHMQVVGPTLTLAGTNNQTSYLTFDGSDDYARLTTDQNPQALSSFPRSGSMTFGMTLKINTFTHVRPFVNRWSGVYQFRFLMFNDLDSTTNIGIQLYNSDVILRTMPLNETSNISTSEDIHFVFTYDAESGELMTFRDGERSYKQLFYDSQGEALPIRTVTDSDLDIGVNQAYSPDRFSAFRFYNLYIYDRVLSDSEIKTIHNSFVGRGYNFA